MQQFSRDVRGRTILAACGMLGVLLLGLGLAPAPQPARAAGILAPGRRIILRAGTGTARSFVRPAPAPGRGSRPAAATINVTYNGFSPEAQGAFQYAVQLWERQITSPVVIEIVANL